MLPTPISGLPPLALNGRDHFQFNREEEKPKVFSLKKITEKRSGQSFWRTSEENSIFSYFHRRKFRRRSFFSSEKRKKKLE